jgi:hypothetical protein
MKSIGSTYVEAYLAPTGDGIRKYLVQNIPLPRAMKLNQRLNLEKQHVD